MLRWLILLLVLLIVGCEEPAIEGCMTDTACNYNADANKDDGSCLENDWVMLLKMNAERLTLIRGIAKLKPVDICLHFVLMIQLYILVNGTINLSVWLLDVKLILLVKLCVLTLIYYVAYLTNIKVFVLQIQVEVIQKQVALVAGSRIRLELPSNIPSTAWYRRRVCP